MTRVPRSDVRATIISATMSSTDVASERIAPVHGYATQAPDSGSMMRSTTSPGSGPYRAPCSKAPTGR